MTFSEYYRGKFQSDLHQVIESAKKMFGTEHHLSAPQPAMQSTTVRNNPIIRNWTQERSDLFAVVLFYTVLIDQACYSHFQSRYDRFRELTLYPKYIGNCLLACHSHTHPSYILEDVAGGSGSTSLESLKLQRRYQLALEAAPIMKQEIREFCEKYMPELESEGLWEVCSHHVKMLNTSTH